MGSDVARERLHLGDAIDAGATGHPVAFLVEQLARAVAREEAERLGGRGEEVDRGEVEHLRDAWYRAAVDQAARVAREAVGEEAEFGPHDIEQLPVAHAKCRKCGKEAMADPVWWRLQDCAPASPEDTEGLEVVGKVWYRTDTTNPTLRRVDGQAGRPDVQNDDLLVRLSDAVEKIRDMREEGQRWQGYSDVWRGTAQGLTARLESVERERDEKQERIRELEEVVVEQGKALADEATKRVRQPLQGRSAAHWQRVVDVLGGKAKALEDENTALRQRLEGMVVTDEMVREADDGAITNYPRRAEIINRALRGEGDSDE